MPGIIKKLGTFTVNLPPNATLPLTPPFEVVDWKHVEVQVDTVAITPGLAVGDVKFELVTALDKDEYPVYAAAAGQFNVAVSEGDSGYGTWEAELRGWAMLQVLELRGVATRVSLRVTVLYKERTT